MKTANMNFNNMIIVKGNLFIEREIFLCNFQSCIQEHNFFVYHIHVQLLYIWWIDAFNIHEHLFIYFLSIENVSFIFFLSNLFFFISFFFIFLKMLISKTNILGQQSLVNLVILMTRTNQFSPFRQSPPIT